MLEYLSRPQFWRWCRDSRLHRRNHLANAKFYHYEASRRRAIQAAEAAGGPRYEPQFAFDGGSLPSEDATAHAREHERRAAECKRQLDEAQSVVADAGRRLLKYLSPQQLCQWPLSGFEDFFKSLPFVAAQQIREIRRQVLQGAHRACEKRASTDKQTKTDNPGHNGIPDGEPRPTVQLRGIAQKPIVLGVEVEPLSEAVYAVVKALLDAGPDGLGKAGLEKVKGDAIKYLRELSNTPIWEDAIRMAGKAGRRYALVWR